MRRYSSDDEERIRMQALVREWARSGLLETAQAETLAADLRVDLRRTNLFLRAGLALFTLLIVAAATGLLAVSLGVRDSVGVAAVTGVAALACVGLADFVAGAYRCYRFGIEEGLAVASVALFAISGGQLWSGRPDIAPLVIGAAGGYGLYRRFGFIYAALGGAVCFAAIPFQYDVAPAIQHAVAAAVAGGVFITARSRRLTFGDDYPGDEYGSLQAAAWAGVYAALNLQLNPRPDMARDWFYWGSYAVTWVMPVIGLRLAIRDRDRELLDVGLALTLVTLLTNKSYLGWARNTWDPIVLGTLLIGVAIAARRWLERGPGGERHGFTAQRILDKDRTARSMLTMVSAALPSPGGAATPGEPSPSAFGGGRSGGAGGGAEF
jgi:hypothetical protein